MGEWGLTTIRRAGCILLPVFFAALFAVNAVESPGQGFPLRGSSSIPVAVITAPAPVPNDVSSPVVSVPAASASADFESQSLIFPSGSRRPLATGQARTAGYVMPSMLSALFFVVVVCGGFGCILYLVKRYLPGHRQLFSHPAIEVLGRTHLDQRRYVSLLRVGKRILVLGVSPDEISSLSEITDDAEITTIMEVARPKTEMGLSIFQRLFQRHITDSKEAEIRALAEEGAREAAERAEFLRKQIGAIADREEKPKPSRRLDTVG